MTEERSELLQGTLDLLVLRILSLEPMHGWGIGERIQLFSGEVFQVNQGSLYPALQRMRRKGWIRAEWRRTENNRRARYYALTPAGGERLAEALTEWRRTSGAVERILKTALAGA
ncbi:MAG TPA: PadR family transcriptional regulator [Longimicrobiales bacterium]|nr:PadR family transcriptional regulator [Longimicrobiales bacterium]